MPPSPSYFDAAPAVNKIRKRWIDIDAMSGVGIDPDISRIPDEIWSEVGGRGYIAEGISLFNQRIVDATAEYTADYKVNSNFFQGEFGRRALANTFAYIKETQPDILRVCDGKFGDVGHTAEKIADEIFGELDADAVLLNPYLGFDAIKPFIEWKDKLVVLCVNTSNQSANEIQELKLENGHSMWRYVLQKSMNEWNYNGNIIPILSATHPDNVDGIRDQLGDTPILLAGVGTQGGSLTNTVPYLLDSEGYGLMISASRAIIYPHREEGESLDDASKRAVHHLAKSINTAKAKNENV